MNTEAAEKRLYELWAEIRDLQSVEDLLDWDQETYMPAGGVEARARTSATVAGVKHQRLTSPELLEALEICGEAPPGSVLAAQVRCARLEVDRAVKVPETLVRELARARATGGAAWQRARAESDFALFEGELGRMVDLKRREAAAIDGDRSVFETLLQHFEPGAREADLVPLFRGLREALTPLVRQVTDAGTRIDASRLLSSNGTAATFPPERQERFGRRLAESIGFDFETGRLDVSTHPFCIGINPSDVRLTWRCQASDFRSATFGVLHESGHGLYEQGLPGDWHRTPLGDAVSLGVHESQSRLWENHVGRSKGFWHWALPHYREAFPHAPRTTPDELWPVLHLVEPSLIRVEADETTYNLHIAVRFEIERALFAGDLEIADLPRAWDDAYEETLGVRAQDAAHGVLQDIHWSQGMFGYFPTYTLGNLIAAQLFAAAERDLGDLDAAFARGEFRPLLDWLRDKVHRHGGRYEAPELVERATGKAMAVDDLLAYLRGNAEQVYGI